MEANYPQSRTRVVVVVLTWNDVEMTTECIASVLESDHDDFKVLLVDNGSEAPCGRQLQEQFPEIEILVLPENQGFTGGGNRGIERALEMGAEYIQLVGNDSTLASDALGALTRALDEEPGVGAVGPLILTSDPEPIVSFYRATVDRDRGAHLHFGHAVPFSTQGWPSVENQFIPFVAMMFRREALLQVGLMDESYGTCWEDYDLCVRMTDADWRLKLAGDAHVIHKGCGTTGEHSPYITYYMIRNWLICLFRFGRPLKSVPHALQILRQVYGQVKAYGFSNWSCHWAMLRGILDFLIGVRGVGNPPTDRRG